MRARLKVLEDFYGYYRNFFRSIGAKNFIFIQVLGVLSSIFNALGISTVIPFLGAALANNPDFILKNIPASIRSRLPDLIHHHVIGISGVSLLAAFVLKNVILMVFMYVSNFNLETYIARLRKKMNFHYLDSIGKTLEVQTKSRMLYLNNQLIQLNSFNYALIDLNLKFYTIFALLILILGISIKLTFLCACFLMLLSVVGFPIFQWTRRSSAGYYESLQLLQVFLVSFFEGAEVIKTLRLESQQSKAFDRQQGNIIHHSMRMCLSRQAIFSLPEMVQMTALVLGILVIRPSAEKAVLLGVFFYSWLRMVTAFNDFSSRFNSAMELKSAPAEIYEYMSSPKAISSGQLQIENIKKLELKDVTVDSGEKRILDHVTVDIPIGRKIQIVGENGSGKSSLIKCVLGLLPYDGEILVNGLPSTALSKDSIFKKISYHSQAPFLFPDTVLENIRLGDSSLTDGRIIEFCRSLGLDRFIRQRKDGFQAFVSEGGANLSGGEKQSIGLARALLVGSEILILDEYTNHLDAETVNLVNDYLRSIKDKTVIVISHLDVGFCDVKIKMKDGKREV